jgi:hypothetical protein
MDDRERSLASMTLHEQAIIFANSLDPSRPSASSGNGAFSIVGRSA